MSEKTARKLRPLAAQPQRSQQAVDNVIAVSMSRRPLPTGQGVNTEYDFKDSTSVRGTLESRLAQEQAVGLILAMLRGFQVLHCRGEFILAAEQGATRYAGRVVVFFAPEVKLAEKIISHARELVEEFARTYPASRVEISVSLKVSTSGNQPR